jgi:hypothetical protein
LFPLPILTGVYQAELNLYFPSEKETNICQLMVGPELILIFFIILHTR